MYMFINVQIFLNIDVLKINSNDEPFYIHANIINAKVSFCSPSVSLSVISTR